MLFQRQKEGQAALYYQALDCAIAKIAELFEQLNVFTFEREVAGFQFGAGATISGTQLDVLRDAWQWIKDRLTFANAKALNTAVIRFLQGFEQPLLLRREGRFCQQSFLLLSPVKLPYTEIINCFGKTEIPEMALHRFLTFPPGADCSEKAQIEAVAKLGVV